MLELPIPFASQTLQDHRSLFILTFYLISCAAITLKIFLNIYRLYQNRKTQSNWHRPYGSQLAIFTILITLSLTTTWYYMLSFFAYSYRDWEAQQSPAQQSLIEIAPRLVKWELWLRDRKLFQEAWESVSETPARVWWSGQIFLWAIGWSLFLGVMGRRYSIPNVWLYMLLGQIVAISFALNLFFVTVLISSSGTNLAARPLWTPPAVLELAPVVVSLLGAAAVPFVAKTPYFMPVLAIPHLLLFIPGLLSPRVLPQGWGGYTSKPTRRYTTVYKWLFTIGIAIQAHSTYSVVLYEQGLFAPEINLGRRLVDAMFEHPAVSSVGWDAVCCLVSVGIWVLLFGELEEMSE